MGGKRIFIAGVDGYLGWSLAQYLAAQGYIVTGIDNWQRRNSWVPSCGSDSAVPIAEPAERIQAFLGHFGEPPLIHDVQLGTSRSQLIIACGQRGEFLRRQNPIAESVEDGERTIREGSIVGVGHEDPSGQRMQLHALTHRTTDDPD